jgi:succinate dehydrogenase hydrophobic anchor subunit
MLKLFLEGIKKWLNDRAPGILLTFCVIALTGFIYFTACLCKFYF